MTSLEGETIVVTGASEGLGKEMALRFSTEGAAVVLVSRTREKLESVAAAAPNETLVAPTDVRDAEDVKRTVSKAVETFGAVDTLVNNAGVGLQSLIGERKRIQDVSVDQWDTIIETNLKGVFLFTRAVLPEMLERADGNVINISSGFGRRAAPKWTPYVTSKWGLEGFTRSVALECEGEGVRVNGLDPGGKVETKFWEDAEDDDMLEPTVMNDAAVYLASQGENGITGESMTAEEWNSRFE